MDYPVRHNCQCGALIDYYQSVSDVPRWTECEICQFAGPTDWNDIEIDDTYAAKSLGFASLAHMNKYRLMQTTLRSFGVR